MGRGKIGTGPIGWSKTIDELAIIQQVVAGDQDAYAELVRAYQARVRRLCWSFLADEHLAEDAAQDVFLKAYRALPRFQGASSFSTWLYRITANHCKDLLRQRARRASESLDALIEEHGESLQAFLTASGNPTLAVESSDLLQRLLTALPDDYRLMLVLREIQGLSYQEFAEVLECSVDAVKARLRRARRELERALRHLLESETSK